MYRYMFNKEIKGCYISTATDKSGTYLDERYYQGLFKVFEANFE